MIASLGRVAFAQAVTCEPTKQLCCSTWVATVTVDGKKSGLLLEDSYEKLSRRIRQHDDWNRKFCKFFGPQSNSCREKVEAPRCRPARTVTSPIEDPFVELFAEADAVITKRADESEPRIRDVERLGRGIARALNPHLRGKNPFLRIGDQMRGYRDSLIKARDQLRRLKRIMETAVAPGIDKIADNIDELWTDNGSFGDSTATRQRRLQIGQQVADLVGGLPEHPAPLPRVDIDRDYTVVGVHPAPPAVIVAVGEHVMTKGFKLTRGDYPLGAVSVSSSDDVFTRAVSATKVRDTLYLNVRDGGRIELRMIPDADGDGVLDAKDHCKDTPGSAALRGCPDQDGDRIPDPKDRCPTLAGNAPTGCPTPSKCNSSQQAGSNAPESHVVSVGKGSGTALLRWRMQSIPDRIQVYYEGRLVHDTHCVDGSGEFPIHFTGHSGLMEVRVLPNCRRNSSGTSWSFSLGCAR
jgi:hypothetical protein